MTRMTRWAASALVLVAGASYAGWSKKGDSTLKFQAAGNIGMKIEGKCATLAPKDDGKTLTLTAQLKDCDTDIGLRNRHMLEDLGAAEFPEVSLAVPLESLKLEDGKTTEADGKGTFTMHGKPVEQAFKYKATCKGGTCDISATMGINVKNHDIKIRSYMGVTVKPDVNIEVTLQLSKS